jgi:hypothetical protein
LKLRNARVCEVLGYVLEGVKLRFSQSGFYENHGYAFADVTPGEKIYGQMYLTKNSFTRSRKLPFSILVTYFLYLPKGSHQQKIDNYFDLFNPTDNIKGTLKGQVLNHEFEEKFIILLTLE